MPFTSAPAAASMLAVAKRTSRLAGVVDALTHRVIVACVGPITAAPLAASASRPCSPNVPGSCAFPDRVGGVGGPFTTAARRRRCIELRGQAAIVDGQWV